MTHDQNPSYFDTVSHIIQQCVVDGLSNVAHRSLHVARGDDLVCARGVLVCGQDADLSTCHLLLVYVHRLRDEDIKVGPVSSRFLWVQISVIYRNVFNSFKSCFYFGQVESLQRV